MFAWSTGNAYGQITSDFISEEMASQEPLSYRLFTRAEVAKHNDSKEPWIIIHDSVYDVTKFLNEVIFLTTKYAFILFGKFQI